MNYKRIYRQLVKRAKARVDVPRIIERHHIKPRCLGGSNRKANIVLFTPAEHYVAHQLLVKIHPGNGKLLWAAIAMTGTGNGSGNGRRGNKLYAWLRTRFIENQYGKRWSSATKCKIGLKSKARNQGVNHPMYGRKHSKKTRAKISAAIVVALANGKNCGKYERTAEWKSALSASVSTLRKSKYWSNKGFKHSEGTKRKMREAKAKYIAKMKHDGTYTKWLNSMRHRSQLGGAANAMRYSK